MYLSATIYVLKWHSLQLDPIARAEQRVFGTLLKPGREILSAFFVAECDITPRPPHTAYSICKMESTAGRVGGGGGAERGRQMIFSKLSD